MKFWATIRLLVLILLTAAALTQSTVSLDDPLYKVRRFTNRVEFDYVAWTTNAVIEKSGQSQLGVAARIPQDIQHSIVTRYFEMIGQVEKSEALIQAIYSDPSVKYPAQKAAVELARQKAISAALNDLAPIAEVILQAQISTVLEEERIGALGQPVPPVLFHSSPLPKALIVSPRDAIRQEVNLSLLADLSLDEISTLEEKVAGYLNASALVVDVGGIGVYPTMVQKSSSLQWTLDTITHEWTHNYLTLHPLGLNYETTPELRTMNETTASIVGTEISAKVLQRYYPELVMTGGKPGKPAARLLLAQVFDFRYEMHETRVRVDELLSQGKIEEAEAYMEERRVIFVQNGYMIRKLNQAYFAFHGAYADQPGGAAGEDPVGPAVRALREKAGTLSAFLRQIARMNSFEDLKTALE